MKEIKMTNTQSLSPESFVDRYGKEVASVAEKRRARSMAGFLAHLDDAVHNLSVAGFDIDDLETGAACLADAVRSEGAEQRVLLKRADQHLLGLDDMCDEYMEMAG